MPAYIDRDSELVTLRSEQIGNATVRVRTRLVGNTAVVDLFEYAPHNDRPLSATKLAGIVRAEAKPHLAKPRAVSLPIADTAIVRERNRLDENGHVVTDHLRVRSLTYVVKSR